MIIYHGVIIRGILRAARANLHVSYSVDCRKVSLTWVELQSHTEGHTFLSLHKSFDIIGTTLEIEDHREPIGLALPLFLSKLSYQRNLRHGLELLPIGSRHQIPPEIT